MMNKTELLWMNSNKSYFEYTTAVLVFFEDKEGEHLYAYQTQSIAGKKFQFWILIAVAAFVVAFSIIGIVSFYLYKQIKIEVQTEEDDENIEIFDQSNRNTFAEQY